MTPALNPTHLARAVALLLFVGTVPLVVKADVLGELAAGLQNDARIRAQQQVSQVIAIQVARPLSQSVTGSLQCRAVGSLAGVSIPAAFQINPQQVLSTVATQTATAAISDVANNTARSAVGSVSGALGGTSTLGKLVTPGTVAAGITRATGLSATTPAPTQSGNSPSTTSTASPLSTIWAPAPSK